MSAKNAYAVKRSYRADYQIVAIFTTEQEAQAYIDRVTPLKPEHESPLWIEAAPIDPDPDRFGAFVAYMRKNGEVHVEFHDSADPATPPMDHSRDLPNGVSDTGMWFVGYGRTREAAVASAESLWSTLHQHVDA